MMAATFVQMVSFMLYKVFFQERMEDQTYIQNLVTQSRRNMKKMNAELQKFQMSMEMESRKRQFEKAMENQKQKMEDGEELPIIGLESMR